jgi:hypothetical protein
MLLGISFLPMTSHAHVLLSVVMLGVATGCGSAGAGSGAVSNLYDIAPTTAGHVTSFFNCLSNVAGIIVPPATGFIKQHFGWSWVGRPRPLGSGTPMDPCPGSASADPLWRLSMQAPQGAGSERGAQVWRVAAGITALALVGWHRAQSNCRFVLPLIHFITDSLSYSVPLLLKQQCDRTLGWQLFATGERIEARWITDGAPGQGGLSLRRAAVFSLLVRGIRMLDSG